MRVLFAVLLLLSMTTGCISTQSEDRLEATLKNESLNDLVSRHSDFYMLYAVAGKEKEFQHIDEVIEFYNIDFNQLLSEESIDTLLFGSFIWLYSGERGYEYVETLELSETPSFIIFNSEQLVFKSSNIEEVDEFLSTREETELIRKRREQRQ